MVLYTNKKVLGVATQRAVARWRNGKVDIYRVSRFSGFDPPEKKWRERFEWNNCFDSSPNISIVIKNTYMLQVEYKIQVSFDTQHIYIRNKIQVSFDTQHIYI